jgi:hypothetical protein
MSDTLIASHPEVPYAAPTLTSPREHLIRAGAHLWRVQDASGRVLGHLRVLHLATGSFRLVGDFWRADDAVAALRNG